MRKRFLSVASIVLLVALIGVACETPPPLTSDVTLTPTTTVTPSFTPPPIPGPREIPPTATSAPLLPSNPPKKAALLFLVDRSNSLKGCAKTQARLDVPYFLISLFQSVPQVIPGWPKIGLKFFGATDTYLPLDSVSQISFDVADYSKQIGTYDTENDFSAYMQDALQLLNQSGAEEKVIVLISDGKMDDSQPGGSKGEQDKVRDWFRSNPPHYDSQGKSDVRFALFHLDCGTPLTDLDMWENKDNIGEDFVYRGFGSANLGIGLQALVENTSLVQCLPYTNAGWWVGEKEKTFLLPGETRNYVINVVASEDTQQIGITDSDGVGQTVMTPIPGQPGMFSQFLSAPEPSQDCSQQMMKMTVADTNRFFGYYFFVPHSLSEYFDQSFLQTNQSILEPSDIAWNKESIQVDIPAQVLKPGLPGYMTLLFSYSPCYNVWVSTPGGVKQTIAQPSDGYSRTDIGKVPLSSFSKQPVLETLANPAAEVNFPEDIRVWVDLVKFPSDSSNFVSIRRQELLLRYRFYPEYAGNDANHQSVISGAHISIPIKYGLPNYYDNKGELAIYALTQKTKNELDHTSCFLPDYSAPSVTLGNQSWYSLPDIQLPDTAHLFVTFQPVSNDILNVLIDQNKFVGDPEKTQIADCDYTKFIIQWEHANDDVSKERPSLLCDLSQTLTCSVDHDGRLSPVLIH